MGDKSRRKSADWLAKIIITFLSVVIFPIWMMAENRTGLDNYITDNSLKIYFIPWTWILILIPFVFLVIYYSSLLYFKNYGYVFSWNEIPGKNNGRLIEYLIRKFGVDWVKTAKIEKVGGDKTIIIYDGKDSLLLKLNDDKNKAILKFDNGKNSKFRARMVNGELNIYNFGSERNMILFRLFVVVLLLIFLAPLMTLLTKFPDLIDSLEFEDVLFQFIFWSFLSIVIASDPFIKESLESLIDYLYLLKFRMIRKIRAKVT